MAYADFTLSSLSKQFSLLRDETTVLFADVSPVSLDPAFLVVGILRHILTA